MKNKIKISFTLFLLLSAFGIGVYQYFENFKAEMAEAYQSSKPANGHSWSEMQCTSDMCMAGGNVGIGTDSPAKKLEVNGDILASGTGHDVCNAAGACLSQLNNFIGAQPIAGGNNHDRAMCTSAGGTLIDIGLANPVCRFGSSASPVSTCPTGWYQYEQWSTYQNKSCTYGSCASLGSCGGCGQLQYEWGCTTTGGSWASGTAPTCSYGCGCNLCDGTGRQGFSPKATCTADRTQIGCW